MSNITYYLDRIARAWDGMTSSYQAMEAAATVSIRYLMEASSELVRLSRMLSSQDCDVDVDGASPESWERLNSLSAETNLNLISTMGDLINTVNVVAARCQRPCSRMDAVTSLRLNDFAAVRYELEALYKALDSLDCDARVVARMAQLEGGDD